MRNAFLVLLIHNAQIKLLLLLPVELESIHLVYQLLVLIVLLGMIVL